MANVTALKPEVKDQTPMTGLSDEYRRDAASKLSDILASTYQLVIKTQVYHWNVVGPLFKPIHELTEEHYNKLFAAADVIAERIRALGFVAPTDFAEMKNFAPTANGVDNTSAKSMVEDLIKDHEKAARMKRELGEMAGDAGDLVTEDMLTERLEFHETAIWMLRATIAE